MGEEMVKTLGQAGQDGAGRWGVVLREEHLLCGWRRPSATHGTE